jgi:uncharacterized protein (TIGR02597 family)
MYLTTRTLLLVPLMAVTASVAPAITLETNPMGILELEVPAQSDALISLPLHRSPAYSGLIDSVDGDSIHLESTSEAIGWSDNEWVYVADSQPVMYYALLMTGDLEGYFFPIIGNDDDSLTLDIVDGNLEDYSLEEDAVQIIPYWTLDSFFADQEALTASASVAGLGARSEVQFYGAPTGVNSVSSEVFYYYDGAQFGGAGWRLKGDDLTAIHDDQPIAPDRAFVFRNITDSPATLSLPGYVQMTQSTAVVEGGLVDQDLPLATSSSVPISLADSNLLENGGFQATSAISGLNGDLLLVIDNSASGFNKTAAAVYYYYDGSMFGGPGWRLKGGDFFTLMDAVEVFQPGQGVILRKAGGDEGTVNLWHFLPTYLGTSSN